MLIRQVMGATLVATSLVVGAGCSAPPRHVNVIDKVTHVTIVGNEKIVTLERSPTVRVPNSTACANVKSGATVDIELLVYPDGQTRVMALTPIADISKT